MIMSRRPTSVSNCVASLNPQALEVNWQILLSSICEMRYPIISLRLLPTLAFTQTLHTFKNGEAADAEQLNESLQYILNHASDGSSATQQDNDAVFEETGF